MSLLLIFLWSADLVSSVAEVAPKPAGGGRSACCEATGAYRPEGDIQIFLPIIYHPIPNIA
jgi:hypothetical protein